MANSINSFLTTIGSRSTPQDILADMKALGASLAAAGFTGRSGHAGGADQAFEIGFNDQFEIYLPWPDFGCDTPYRGKTFVFADDSVAMQIASEIHPNWKACSRGAKLLHSRNVYQVLGADLKTPSIALICWTKDGKTIGGTATAINLARRETIPVYNLATMSSEEVWKEICSLTTTE